MKEYNMRRFGLLESFCIIHGEPEELWLTPRQFEDKTLDFIAFNIKRWWETPY